MDAAANRRRVALLQAGEGNMSKAPRTEPSAVRLTACRASLRPAVRPSGRKAEPRRHHAEAI